MPEFNYLPFDRDIWNKELEAFVPDVIYDMHTHMWSETHRVHGDPVSEAADPA